MFGAVWQSELGDWDERSVRMHDLTLPGVPLIAQIIRERLELSSRTELSVTVGS